MQTLYWICFAVGGMFVLLAMLSGLDEVDFAADDFDLPLDSDLEITDPGDGPRDRRRVVRRAGQGNWIGILTSLKFWTFGACFFGLTGLVLSHLSAPLPAGFIAIAALTIGLICGAGIAGALRLLRRRHANSFVQADDLVGLTGTVELPFDPHQRGKIRLQIKGTWVERIACTDEPREFQVGDSVLIVSTEQDRLWVVSTENLQTPVDQESGVR